MCFVCEGESDIEINILLVGDEKKVVFTRVILNRSVESEDREKGKRGRKLPCLHLKRKKR